MTIIPQNGAYWIKHLNLQSHPEGGFYRETFRSAREVLRPSSPAVKQAVTSIYYLLEGKDFSGFHRIASDEVWYFHKGAPLHIHVLEEDGSYGILVLSDEEPGSLSVVVQTGLWFAAEIPSGSGFTLVSCAVAPGFDFNEFEMAQKAELMALYHEHSAVIERLCRA